MPQRQRVLGSPTALVPGVALGPAALVPAAALVPVAAVVLGVVLALVATTAAGAATVVEYVGTATRIAQPEGPQPPAGFPNEFDAVIRMECDGPDCTVSGLSALAAFSDSAAVVFEGSSASRPVQMGMDGDLAYTCGVPIEQQMTIVTDGDDLSIRIDPVTTDVGDCHYFGPTVTFEGVVSSRSGDGGGAAGASEGGDTGISDNGTGGDETASTPASGSSSRLGAGSFSAPSSLSALPTIAQAPVAPGQLVAALLITLILLVLVAFPTALLNSASEQLTERFEAWRHHRGRRRGEAHAPVADDERAGAAPAPRVHGRGLPVAALTVLAAAVIASFSDPQFGWNPGSLRVLASIALGFGIDVVLGWTVVILVMRSLSRAHRVAFEAKPMTLIVVLGAVALTRITGFEPGILFGVVAGVAFVGLRVPSERVRPVLVALGYAFVLAVAAWLAYSAMSAGASADDGAVFARESLAAIAAAGFAALPIALVPLRGLPGYAVFAWSRRVWAGCYALGLFAFFFVLMPMPSSWGEVSLPLWGWIIAYALYCIGALVLWAIAARPWTRGRGPAGDPSDGAGDDADIPASSRRHTPRIP